MDPYFLNPVSGALRFLTDRLLGFAGYNRAPTIHDDLTFFLPPFQKVFGRYVGSHGKWLEIWSPNSLLVPYYPGIRAHEVVLGRELPAHLRRSDGHLGRFDYTVSPQHFDRERPWLGLIRRQAKDSRAENSPFVSVWTSRTTNLGRFKPNYVNALLLRLEYLVEISRGYASLQTSKPVFWTNRPQYLSAERLESFRQELSLDDAIDMLASLQRDLKEISAWNRMAGILDHESLPTFVADNSRTPMADDSLMGVWLNGCEESDAKLLLRNRVPCFIVHRVDGVEDIDRVLTSHQRYPSMASGTAIMNLTAPHNILEKRLLEGGQPLLDLTNDLGIELEGKAPRGMRTDRMRSSPFKQGWICGKYVDPRSLAIAPKSKDSINLMMEKDGYLLPPPVMKAEANGRWSIWELGSDDKDEEFLLKVSEPSMAEDDKIYKYYDRQRKRILYLSTELQRPPFYDAPVEIYGLPGPQINFAVKVNNTEYHVRPRSAWVYLSKDPLKGDYGRRFDPPGPPPFPPAFPPSSKDDDNGVSWRDDDDSYMDVDKPYDVSANPPASTSSLVIAADSTSLPPNVENTMEMDEEPERPRPSAFSSTPLPSSGHRGFLQTSTRVRDHGTSTANPSANDTRILQNSGLTSQTDRYFVRGMNPRQDRSSDNDPPRRSRSISPGGDRPSRTNHRREGCDMFERNNAVANHLPPSPRPGPPVVFTSMPPDRIAAIFPTPVESPIPRVARMSINTRYLILWNVPNLFTWDDVLKWLQKALPLTEGSQVTRILRTCEHGFQVFWLVFRSVREAMTFRGLAENRETDNGNTVRCDFVSYQEYCGASGGCDDVWLYDSGHKLGLPGTDPFRQIAPRRTPRSLSARLGFEGPAPPPSRTRRGTKAGKSKRDKKDKKDKKDPDPK